MLDDDGYPTDEALDLIAKWDYKDIAGWFEFIQSLWALTDWKIEDATHDIVLYRTRNTSQYSYTVFNTIVVFTTLTSFEPPIS